VTLEPALLGPRGFRFGEVSSFDAELEEDCSMESTDVVEVSDELVNAVVATADLDLMAGVGQLQHLAPAVLRRP
jgi:hypothetical protein